MGKESLHCETHLCKDIVKSYRTPALHGLAPFPQHLEPKAPQKRLISKVSKPFRQSLPNPFTKHETKLAEFTAKIVKWIMCKKKMKEKHEFGRVDTKLTFGGTLLAGGTTFRWHAACGGDHIQYTMNRCEPCINTTR